MRIEGAAPGVAPRRLLSPGEAPGPPLSFEGLSAEKKKPKQNECKRFRDGGRGLVPPRPLPRARRCRRRTRPVRRGWAGHGGAKLLSNSKAIRMSAKKVLTRALSVIM